MADDVSTNIVLYYLAIMTFVGSIWNVYQIYQHLREGCRPPEEREEFNGGHAYTLERIEENTSKIEGTTDKIGEDVEGLSVFFYREQPFIRADELRDFMRGSANDDMESAVRRLERTVRGLASPRQATAAAATAAASRRRRPRPRGRRSHSSPPPALESSSPSPSSSALSIVLPLPSSSSDDDAESTVSSTLSSSSSAQARSRSPRRRHRLPARRRRRKDATKKHKQSRYADDDANSDSN